MKVAGRNAVVVWQVSHVVGKPAAAWLGLMVALKRGRWQEAHAEGNPANCVPVWQEEQRSAMCAPLNWNLECAKRAPKNWVVEWHSEQSVGKPAAAWFGLVVLS